VSQPTWKQVQDALRTAISVAGGLPTIWRDQDANQPGADYVGLSLGRVATVDVDWVDERYDDEAGQIALTLAGTREVMLQIEVWSTRTVEKVAEETARATCDKIVSKLRLPLARNAFKAVGVVPFDPGPTNWVPSVVAAGFRGRAQCDVRCRMPARAYKEYANWIEGIAGYATIMGLPGGEVTVPFDSGISPDHRMYWGTAEDPGSYTAAFIETLINAAGVGSRQRAIAFAQPQQTYNGGGQPTGPQVYAWVALPEAIDGDSSNYISGAAPYYQAGLNVVGQVVRQGVTYNVRRSDYANLGNWVLNIT
jgi:hypothetical protein